MKINLKIILISSFLAFIFLGGTLLYISDGAKKILSEYILISAKRELEMESIELNIFFEDARKELATLSRIPPIQGIFRAQRSDGFDVQGDSSLEDWKNRLATIFISTVESEGVYYQLRYIDENGQEIVRVDFNESGSKKIQKENLQNKSDRFYFQEAIELEEGEFYSSQITLNREGNPPEIEVPYAPVFRFATSVFNEESGEKKGILIANVYLSRILGNLQKFALERDSFEETTLFDQDGNYIFHKDKSKEWGGEQDLGTGENFKKDYPVLAEKVFGSQEETLEDGDSIYFFKKIILNSDQPDNFIILFQDIHKDILFQPLYTLFLRIALAGLFTFLILFATYSFFVNKLLSPLKELTLKAEQIGKGNFSQKVKIRSQDEIGKLAKTFNLMAAKLQELYVNLDKKVKERTREIEEVRNNLEVISRRLKLATEAGKIGIWEWDITEDILIWDEQMYKLYGIKNNNFGGTYEAWKKVLHPDDKKRGNQEIQEALRGGKQLDTFFRIIWPDKSICYVRAIALVLRDAKGKPLKMIGVSWDITQEKEVDRAKNEFVSLASHQLRTPLTSIKWYAEMLLAGDAGKINKNQEEFLNEIHNGNERMVDLVDALLNVSRIELGNFVIESKDSDVVDLVRESLEEVRVLANSKKIEVKEEYDENIPDIKLDPRLIGIVFQNLLSNAIKYSPEKEKIYLRIKLKSKNIIIEVADNGYGIPNNQKNKIFSKLFRADNIKKKDLKGNGLGLYIVKSIIEQSGGKIWFESEEDKGTSFFVEIPLSGMKNKKGSKKLD